jgi:hypothetical protein
VRLLYLVSLFDQMLNVIPWGENRYCAVLTELNSEEYTNWFKIENSEFRYIGNAHLSKRLQTPDTY